MSGKNKETKQEEVKEEVKVEETEVKGCEIAEEKCETVEKEEETIETVEETIKNELKDMQLPVAVYDNDRLVRTYNKIDHGEDYKEKAIMFANKNGYQVK